MLDSRLWESRCLLGRWAAAKVEKHQLASPPQNWMSLMHFCMMTYTWINWGTGQVPQPANLELTRLCAQIISSHFDKFWTFCSFAPGKHEAGSPGQQSQKQNSWHSFGRHPKGDWSLGLIRSPKLWSEYSILLNYLNYPDLPVPQEWSLIGSSNVVDEEVVGRKIVAKSWIVVASDGCPCFLDFSVLLFLWEKR